MKCNSTTVKIKFYHQYENGFNYALGQLCFSVMFSNSYEETVLKEGW